MTNKLKYTTAALLLLAVFTISGCLKDDAFDNGSIQSNHNTGADIKPIELKISATDGSKFATVAIDNSGNDTLVDFVPVVLATANAAPEDIHVTLEMDSSLVQAYNDAQGEAYNVPPASMYEISSMEVTIPKGSNTGYLQLKVKPSDFIAVDWAFGFKIKSVQEAGYTISSNFSDGVVSLAIKNQYDGVYLASGHFDHPSFGGDYSNKQWICKTSGSTSVSFQLNTTVLFGAVIKLTVNTDNSVDISSDDVVLDPYDADKNYYTPDDKTFHLDFGYSGETRHLTGIAVYDHPR